MSQIVIIMNFAVVSSVDIKRVACITLFLFTRKLCPRIEHGLFINALIFIDFIVDWFQSPVTKYFSHNPV